MKILLVGEYSGLFNCLKNGLQNLGHSVYIASDGDGYRNYPSDFRWDSKLKGRLAKYKSFLNICSNLNKFSGYDIVLVISFRPLGFQKLPNRLLFDFLLKNNGKVFVSGAGFDYFGFDYWYNRKESKVFKYLNGYIQEYQNIGKKFPLWNNPELKEEELKTMSKIAGYIPIMYEYAEPFRNFPQTKKTIPIPININNFNYRPNIIKDKIVFFHGITRACKGGEFIYKAFEELTQKYNKIAEFHCEGGLPFDKYITLLQKTNVVLNGTNGYSLGMNSLFSMSQGRIVMGEADPLGNKELEYESCPALSLKPDVSYIKQQIEYIIDNRDKIEELGYKSRTFIEKYHNYINIAEKYLTLWSNG